MPDRIYIVQGDPRDHHGEIALVTRSKHQARRMCFAKILEYNPIDDDPEPITVDIHADAEKLTMSQFLHKYLGQAWICTPQLVVYECKPGKQEYDFIG